MRESEIESKVNEKGEAMGFIQTKMGSLSHNGWPDRIFLYRSFSFFIEYKATGEKPTPLQMFVHNKLRQAGFKVEVVDSVEQGIDILREWKQYADQELGPAL